ncbi:MAG: PAS domain S-box protein, partial [Pseudomonadota bacterium]
TRMLIDKGTVIEYETNLMKKDGTKVAALLSVFLVKDATGKRTGSIEIATDMTDKKELERELKEAKDYLESLIEGITDPFAVVDEKGIVTYVNQPMLEMTGYKKEDILGQHASIVYPDSTDEARRIKRLLDEKGSIKNYETRFLTKDGREVPVIVSFSLTRDKDGHVIGSLGICKDITERKRLENELREITSFMESVLESSPNSVVVTDTKGIITYVNRRSEEISGFKRNERVGTRADQYYVRGYEEARNLQQLLKEHGSAQNYEVEIRRKDGATFMASMSVSLLKNHAGETIGTIGTSWDTTEVKRLETEVEKARNYLENIIESIVDGIIITDNRGVITFVNAGLENMTGRKREEEVGQNISRYWPEGEEGSKNLQRMLNEKDKIHSYDTLIKRKDGAYLPAILSVAVLRGKDGKSTGGLLVCKDITERQNLEERLKESEIKYRSFVEDMIDGYFVIQKGKFAYLNKAFENIFGYAPDELSGKSFTTLAPRESAPRREGYTKRATKGLAMPTLYEAIRKDQTRIYVEASIKTAPYEGHPALIGTLRDVTDHIKMDEKLRHANQRLITQRKLVDKKAGALQTALVQLKEKNRELKETQSQLLQQEKLASIGQLAAGVAHEINNPVAFVNSNLGTIGGHTKDILKLLRKFEDGEEILKHSTDERISTFYNEVEQVKAEIDLNFILEDCETVIAESLEGTERVRKIIQNLKDFSHVDEGELKYADINEGVESTLNIVWNELKYKARVTKDYGDIPEINCYPQQLNQVFMNVLVNAAHAIEKQGEISVKTYCDNGCVCIQISDTGCGIPAENIPKLFDPFFTTKEVGKGTGLGLSMAYGIVQKHGGRIRVESTVGKGSTFTIELPTEGNVQ